MESTSTSPTFCSICLETEDVHTRRVTFPCQHMFHIHCVEEYLEYYNETIDCPVCRTTWSSGMLRSVFQAAHAHTGKDVRIIVRDIPSIDETTANEQSAHVQNQGCRKADVIVIALLLIGLSIYLLALYNII